MQQVRIIATRQYEKQVRKLLPVIDRDAMETAIAANPEAYPIVSGTGGVRKARWSRPGMGKRGGIRVIYYFWVEPNAVILIMVYAKSEKEDLSDADKKEIRKIIEAIQRGA